MSLSGWCPLQVIISYWWVMLARETASDSSSPRALVNDDLRCVGNQVKQCVHDASSPGAAWWTIENNVPAICRAPLTQTPLSIPTVRACISQSAAQPRLAPSSSHTYHIPSGPPHPPRTAAGGFRKPGYSVTKKSPMRKTQFVLLLGRSNGRGWNGLACDCSWHRTEEWNCSLVNVVLTQHQVSYD